MHADAHNRVRHPIIPPDLTRPKTYPFHEHNHLPTAMIALHSPFHSFIHRLTPKHAHSNHPLHHRASRIFPGPRMPSYHSPSSTTAASLSRLRRRLLPSARGSREWRSWRLGMTSNQWGRAQGKLRGDVRWRRWWLIWSGLVVGRPFWGL